MTSSEPLRSGKLMIFLLLFSFLCPCLKAGDKPGQSRPLLELSTTPVSQYDSLNPEDLAVLGVHLGMSKLSVKKHIARKAGVYLRQDKFFDARMYLYEYVPQNEKQKPLAYFKCDEENKILEEIIIYPHFAQYMPKANDYLVTSSVLGAPKNPHRLALGKIRESESILEVPSQQIQHTAYYFFRSGFRVIKQVSGKNIKYTFSWFRPKANGKAPGS